MSSYLLPDLRLTLVLTETHDLAPEVLECIDLAFSKFGSSVSAVVYWNFEHSTKLSRRDILHRPDLFSKAIHDIFSDGSAIIEKAIVSELKATFHLSNRNYSGIVDALSDFKKMHSSN